MRSILIAYDLIGTDETSADYKRLIKHIQEDYSNWAKVLYSTFVVRSTETAKQVRDNLNAYTDANDRLFVAELTGVAAWRNVICTDDWLMKNL
jgi:hypothetical protein